MREGERARRDALKHFGNRYVLDMDELARMKDVRPRIEKEYTLPGDSRRGNKVWMFSIDGTLDGKRMNGCLFAGECIIVQERNFERAFRLAKDGLAETIKIALEVFEEQKNMVVSAKPLDAIVVEVGGKSTAAIVKEQELATDPKMRAMLRHILGGGTWLW